MRFLVLDMLYMNDKSFYTILNQYNNQTPDSLLDAKEYNAAITPYQSKNYICRSRPY